MVTPSGRTQKRQAETREKIFREAMRLFAEKGFDNTTVAEIAESADIGKGTFFTHFATKEAVFRVPGEMAIEAMIRCADNGRTSNKSPTQILAEVMTVFLSWHEENRAITMEMTRWNEARSVSLEGSNKFRMLALLTQIITDGQSSGLFRAEFHAHEAAIVFLGIYFSVIAAWVHDGGSDLIGRMQRSIEIVLRGLSR